MDNNLEKKDIIEISDNGVVNNSNVDAMFSEGIPPQFANAKVPVQQPNNINTSTENVQQNVNVTNNVTPKEEVTSSEFYGKEKKKWPWILLLVVVALVGAGCYYYFVATTPKNVIKKLFNSTYSEVKKMASNNSISGDINSIDFNGNFILTSTLEELKEMSGLNAKVAIGYDLKNNNNNYLDLNATLKDQKLIDLMASITDEKIYLNFKDAYPKTVYIDNSGEDAMIDMSEIKIDNTKVQNYSKQVLYIIEKVKDAVVDGMSEEKMSKVITLKDIDSKKTPVIEIKYKVDFQEAKKILSTICDKLINDNMAIEYLSELMETEKEDVKEELKDAKESFDESDFDGPYDAVLDVEILTNKLLQFELSNENTKVTYLERKNSTDMEIKINEIGNISFTFDKNENKLFIDAKVTMDGETNRVAVTVKINEMTKTTLDSAVNLVVYDTKDINKEMLTLSGQFKYELNKAIKTIDIENAVDMTKLNESEMQKVQNALTPAMGLLSGM